MNAAPCIKMGSFQARWKTRTKRVGYAKWPCLRWQAARLYRGAQVASVAGGEAVVLTNSVAEAATTSHSQRTATTSASDGKASRRSCTRPVPRRGAQVVAAR